MSGTRRLAARGALTTAVPAIAVPAVAVLAAALATSLLAPTAAIAGGERGGWHGGAGTAEPTTAEPATAGAPTRAHLPPIATLNAVSCPSARLCMVIGSTPSKSTVVLRWNGRSWADLPVPRPATDSLGAIWCGSATSCLAVGESYRDASGSSRSVPLAELWYGYGWTVLPVPRQAHTFQSGLAGIDCSSATACTAVGSYTTAKSGYDPPTYALAEGWNGQTWQLETATDPEPKATELSSVSCSPASACTAVGTSTSGGLVAERWTARSGRRSNPSPPVAPARGTSTPCPAPRPATAPRWATRAATTTRG